MRDAVLLALHRCSMVFGIEHQTTRWLIADKR
jgi:hypothetical protein